MSAVFPNAIVARAYRELGGGERMPTTDLETKINAGLQRLYAYQHMDGGWGWWFDDASDAYMTAYVLFGLALTRDAGYQVEEKVIQTGADWLTANLDGLELPLRTYALYSLAIAGSGDLEETLNQLAMLEMLNSATRQPWD